MKKFLSAILIVFLVTSIGCKAQKQSENKTYIVKWNVYYKVQDECPKSIDNDNSSDYIGYYAAYYSHTEKEAKSLQFNKRQDAYSFYNKLKTESFITCDSVVRFYNCSDVCK